MSDYIKQNFPVLLIGIGILSVVFFGVKVNSPAPIVNVNGGGGSSLGAINNPSSTITNPHTFEQGVTLNANPNGTSNSLTSSATTSIAASFDGHIVYDDFTMSTGTAKAVYTNSYGPMECKDAYIYAKNTGFVPGLTFTLGSSTSATGYSTNLIASTTVGTTTTQLIASLSSVFILGSGESIVGAVQQAYADASSTHLGNMSAQFGVRCNLIGG